MANTKSAVIGIILIITGIILMIAGVANGGTGDNPVTKWQVLFWIGVASIILGAIITFVGYTSN
jgi:uncharacterized membrane protein HdeD (DUF308 family)